MQLNIPPAFKREAGNPVFTQSNQNPAMGAATAPSIYWPWIIKVADIVTSPIDDYYMYYSTDHDSGNGGIYFASAPSPKGPWTGQGLVYTDTVSGDQTETPSVVWNENEQKLFMYYHNDNVSGTVGVQTTCLATSTDGQTWTRVGPVLDAPAANMFPGDGHTGYFRPFRIGNRWFGYHLMGGTDYPHFNISYSSDGRDWQLHPHPLGYGDDQFTDGRRIEWTHSDVVWWKGRLWWVGLSSDFASGGATTDRRIVVAPLADDLRHLLGEPIIQLYPTSGGNESTNYRSTFVYVDGDELILYYQCDDNFNVAVAS